MLMINFPTNRQNNFNLLRLVFATLVLLSHAPELLDGNRSRELLTNVFHTVSFGEFAVDGFFLLSGYLIVKSWCNAPDLVQFSRSRILRIFPGFIVATILCAFVVGPLASTPAVYFSDFSFLKLAESTAQLKPPTLPMVFAGTHYASVNGAMWTISWEFACYIGVLVAGLIGLTKKPRLWLILTVTLLAIFTLQRFGFLSHVHGKYLFSHPLVRLGSFFLVGGTFYLFHEKFIFDRKIAGVAAAALLIGMFSWRLSELVLATAGGYLLFYFAFARVPYIVSFNKLPDISYGVYLYGWPVQKLLLWYFPTMSPWLLFIGSCGGAFTLGAMSWYAIEKPCLKFKRKKLNTEPIDELTPAQNFLLK